VTIGAGCFFCGKALEEAFRTEHSIHYRGMFVGRYRITVCDGCYTRNVDGVRPPQEASLLAHVTALGLPMPDRNEQGLLPRD